MAHHHRTGGGGSGAPLTKADVAFIIGVVVVILGGFSALLFLVK